MRENYGDKRGNLLIIFISILVITSIFIGGVIYFRNEASSYQSTEYDKLKTVAYLKAKRIEQWRSEIESDIKILAGSPTFNSEIFEFLQNSRNKKLKQRILNRFQVRN